MGRSKTARAAWGLPFELSIVDDACEVVKAEKLVAKSKQRFRRPTKDELERLTDYFREKEKRRSSIPMSDIMWFAVHSARRHAPLGQRDAGCHIDHARYEDLVASTESETRAILEYLGLPWQEACMQYFESGSASTTASASQVRRPVYGDSVGKWQHYEAQLAPLVAQLDAAGVQY